MLYEMNSEVLDHAAEIFRDSRDEDEEPNFPIPEVVDVFKEPSTKQTLMDLMVTWFILIHLILEKLDKYIIYLDWSESGRWNTVMMYARV